MSWCALNDPFEPKVLSSVRFRWCERINRTRVHAKLSEARLLKIGGFGSLDTTPNADLWFGPTGVNVDWVQTEPNS